MLGLAIVAAGILVVAAHRAMALDGPLWLDESWTGALASVGTVTELLHQASEEAGGPFYYLLIWMWVRVFGDSNVSLHLSSLVFTCIAPLIAWRGLRRLQPSMAIAWAVLLATWNSGLAQSGFARCYPVLLTLSVATSVQYIALVREPTRGRAAGWAALATATILTHYYSGLLVATQAAAFLLVHRRRALEQLPAVLVFTPALAWIVWNLPRLGMMTSPDLVGYNRVSMVDIPIIASYFLGVRDCRMLPFIAAGLLIFLLARRRRGSIFSVLSPAPAVLYTGWAALAAVVLIVGLSMLHPLLELRYLTPFAPGVALLIAYWMVATSAGRRSTLGLLLAASVILSATYWIDPRVLGERAYNYEVASKWIAEVGPSKLVFFWDNPIALTVARDQMSLVGGFFLERDGTHLEVVPRYPTLQTDMNGVIGAGREAGSAVIWLYDLNVRGTTAISHPPELSKADPGLECRDFGRERIGVVACRPKTLSSFNAKREPTPLARRPHA